jgi:hypothetical protein
MRLLPLAVLAATLLSACGDDVVYVPLREFSLVPLHASVGYSSYNLDEPLSSEVSLDRHSECSALTKEHTATYDGEPVEAQALGGFFPVPGQSGVCSFPVFRLLSELEGDTVPPTFRDGTFELSDATHTMRIRVKDWWGPHGPVLPPTPVDVAQAEPLEVKQGEDLFIPYLPASADLSKVGVMRGRSGGGTPMEVVPVPGGVRLRLGALSAGTYFFYFSGSVKLQVLECTGTRTCSAGSGPHFHKHAFRVRIVP